MEKKRNHAKPIAFAALAVMAVVVLALIFSGCATNIRQIDANGDYTIGGERVLVNVPTDGTSEYNVQINTSDADYSGETLVETVERIRPAVVDVYALAANGDKYAGSGVIVGGAYKTDNAVEMGATSTSADTMFDQYYIVTNHHVIDGCIKFTVDLLFIADDDTETHGTYTATLVGGSPARDIAVLRIERKADERIVLANVLADSSKVKVGTEVLAIGNPLGILGGTVTRGIVSATAREVNVGSIGSMTLMQTDTAINGGNSGGGLFDTSGRLIGIVNSGYETDSSGASVEGLNFAIPANDAMYAAKSLIETYTYANGVVTQYGYVSGDTNFGLTCKDATFSSDKTGVTVNVTYAQSVDAASPIYGKVYSQTDYYAGKCTYIHAITAVTYHGETTEVTSGTELLAALKKVKIETNGDNEVTFTVKKITTGMFGSMTLDNDNSSAVTVTATQYIYTI